MTTYILGAGASLHAGYPLAGHHSRMVTLVDRMFKTNSEKHSGKLAGDVTSEKAQTACVLAIAYSREFKLVPAKLKLIECRQLAGEANDAQSLGFAAAANAQVQMGLGDPASATGTLERLFAKAPDNPDLHIELAVPPLMPDAAPPVNRFRRSYSRSN